MFKIGEFSKIAHVAASQLRYYDEIGIFIPAHVDRFTGHRFYSIDQLPRLNQILALKDLGFTLNQITQTIDTDISIDTLEGMLTMKKAQIEQSLREDILRLRQVEMRLQQLRFSENPTMFDVVMKSIAPQSILSIRDIFPSYETAHELIGRIYTSAQKKHKLQAYTVIIHGESVEENQVELECGFLSENNSVNNLMIPDSEYQLTRSILPAIDTMATLTYVGEPQGVMNAYAELGKWIVVQGYQLDGAPREIYWEFVQDQDSGAVRELTMDLQFPVAIAEHGF